MQAGLNIPATTIAIDGPAASGKSTLADLLARRLGYLYFDTGVMYRAVTWAALTRNVPLEDEAAVTRLAAELHIEVLPPTVEDGRRYTVLADGVDVTWAIRSPEVDASVSRVAAYPGVRSAMVPQQRRIAARGSVIMVGRDIGTVVLPDADVKLYLDATVEERARRRWLEMRAQGREADYEPVLASMRQRDEMDSHRDVSPLCAAHDAIILDTTGKSVEEVLAEAERLIRHALAAKGKPCPSG
ncbi:MAG: (d)CMP kinase [Anaerolineae bacterium]|nr:(d)CMP kinase [Anaerolineae bacterium]